MRTKAQHFSILVVDIEKFGSRSNPVQLWLRKRLYELVEAAFDEAGIDHRNGPRPADRGDGFFWLLPGTVDKVDLTGRFVDLLHDNLREHARTSSEEGAMRLRVALHDGDVAQDEHGWAGEELNSACRLVDIAPLRTALAQARRSGMALAVSSDWYRRTVRHGHPAVERQTFRRVLFEAKEIQGESAWIRVPGYDIPPGIEEAAPDNGSTPGPALATGPHVPTPTAGAPALSGPFSNPTFGDVGQVFGGDQVVHGPQTFIQGGRRSDQHEKDGTE
ncbi:hypothetical protein ABIA33_004719 [Streptacidiphilus sp. MAP12-16]|uniref:hypothetical protein n=1 Tax=Streptacidiphilus sp. MAP12-16 TaxID=3156300 RepID=UPI003517DF38